MKKVTLALISLWLVLGGCVYAPYPDGYYYPDYSYYYYPYGGSYYLNFGLYYPYGYYYPYYGRSYYGPYRHGPSIRR